jgi:YidC/Oxa1 family membrane protein insertase
MSDTQRAVLAFILIALVLILAPRYLKWLSPQREAPAPPQEQVVTPQDQEPQIAEEPAVPTETELPAAAPVSVPTLATAERWDKEVVTIETNLYRAVVSSRGGGTLEEFELAQYPHGSGEGNVQLIPANGEHINLQVSYVNLDGDSVYLTQNFEVLQSPETDYLRLNEGSTDLVYQYQLPSGAKITKRISFYADNYTMSVEVQWEHQQLEFGINAFEIGWPNGLEPAEKVLKEDETYGKVYVYQGGELEKEGSVRKGRVPRRTLKGSTDWVALRNKYFAAAFIAGEEHPADFGALSAKSTPYGQTQKNGNNKFTRYSMAIGYEARNSAKLTLYLGPLSYFIIRDLDVDLERTMNLGFSLIRPISRLVLVTLVFFHKYIPNYGVVLILFAIIIRILTNPLTKRSAISTQKMQLVQPKVKALQDKYKGNPQKLNQEMMALWKSEGVNPLGGCLPILVQMPVLIALFTVFRSTIELRGQPFILWVKDLSVPDVVFTLPFSIPLYGDGVTILALIMGITMFIQQKLSGTGANPQQKPMMYMMTGMFFLIFNQFPSGLNLYYAFSNILAIFQQRNVRKHLLTEEPVPPTKEKVKAKAAPKLPQARPKRKRSK